MQFVVTAWDGTDDLALERRLAARPAHLELGRRQQAEGRRLFAAALLDDEERMVGSVIVADFPDRGALDAWLAEEPYVTGRVWERVEVRACRVSPTFLAEDSPSS
jgi:uncharacterized protein YciI